MIDDDSRSVYSAVFIPLPKDLDEVIAAMEVARAVTGEDANIVGVPEGFIVYPNVAAGNDSEEGDGNA